MERAKEKIKPKGAKSIMPNHVISDMQISGPASDIKRFKQAITEGKEWNINKLYPNPLAGFQSPISIVSKKEYDAFPEDHPTGKPMTQAMHDKFVKQYGTADWYEWTKTHWGTKWGIYNIHSYTNDNDPCVRFTYDTAWNPATKLWMHVSSLFPTLRFASDYAQDGLAFIGDETYQNGKVIESGSYKKKSVEAHCILENLGMI